MDKIHKVLQRLSKKERQKIEEIIQQLENKNLKDLQIKKLKGYNDVFRIRKGDIRIIYRVSETDEIFILAIERRSEKTYRNF